MCFQGDKTSVHIYWFCGAFCVSDGQVTSGAHCTTLRKAVDGPFHKVLVYSSGWWSGWGCMGWRRSLFPCNTRERLSAEGASPASVPQQPSYCRVRPTTPDTLYMLPTSEKTLKKKQNGLKVPRPSSSLQTPTCSEDRWKLLQLDTISFCPQRRPGTQLAALVVPPGLSMVDSCPVPSAWQSRFCGSGCEPAGTPVPSRVQFWLTGADQNPTCSIQQLFKEHLSTCHVIHPHNSS